MQYDIQPQMQCNLTLILLTLFSSVDMKRATSPPIADNHTFVSSPSFLVIFFFICFFFPFFLLPFYFGFFQLISGMIDLIANSLKEIQLSYLAS